LTKPTEHSDKPMVTPPFRFLIGEFALWVWRPRLVLVDFTPGQSFPWLQVSPAQIDSPADGMLCRSLPPDALPPGISRLNGWVAYVQRLQRCYHVQIAGSFEDYLSKFSAKRRHNLKRSARWFADRSEGCPLSVAKSPEEMMEFHRQAIEISRQTYQERLLKAGMPAGKDYLSHMQQLAASGMARGYLLRDGAKSVAFAWCEGKGQRLNYSIIGYLPDYAPKSPGTALLYLILEDLFREKTFSLLSFGVGEGWYKESFSTGFEEFIDAVLLRPSWRLRGLVWLHALCEKANQEAGRLLEKAGIKRTIKQWMRRFASSASQPSGPEPGG